MDGVLVCEGVSYASNAPHAMIHPLSEKFNGRLCPILLSGRHVQVVHKDDTFLAHRRTKDALATFVQLGHD